jgi:quinol monooxygenase YgiN
MSQPIVFISHHRIKPGKADELKALTKEMWTAMEKEKPRTLMNLSYVNDEGTEVAFMHAFADVEAMQLHWQGAGERTKRAYEYIEPIGFEIYGDAGDQITEGMRSEAASSKARLTLVPNFVFGWLRLAPAGESAPLTFDRT